MNLVSRYGEAYVIARSTVSLGRIVKRVSLYGGLGLVGLGLVLIARDAYSNYNLFMPGIITLLVGASCVVGGFVTGGIISAQGQIMLALLDTAVNTSPLATNEEKNVALK
jgi:hypothetical protein